MEKIPQNSEGCAVRNPNDSRHIISNFYFSQSLSAFQANTCCVQCLKEAIPLEPVDQIVNDGHYLLLWVIHTGYRVEQQRMPGDVPGTAAVIRNGHFHPRRTWHFSITLQQPETRFFILKQ